MFEEAAASALSVADAASALSVADAASALSVADDASPRVRVAKTAVGWSTRIETSRATASRGSRSPEDGAGTGAAAGSPDDFCCFDLSGDSPATDASFIRPAPNRSSPNSLSEPCTSVLCEGLALVLDENDIPTGSLTNRSRTLDRPL
ncbi:hypothetical protein [Streptomyces himalayensis]|uniref:hypothetical protein n=1 Tax=Streptomyces himalayensis TaxID=2820085 RepID=UPI001FE89DD1|nr:hypothetical protein [Streptomyces himalayensis]